MANEIEKPAQFLFNDIRELIDNSRQRFVVAVNAELTLLYWNIGKKINDHILGNERAEYGKQIVASLARQLTEEYGKGWGEQQIRHSLRSA